MSEASSSQADVTHWEHESPHYEPSLPLSATFNPLLTLAIVDPAKASHHFSTINFDALNAIIGGHLWNTGPVPDIALFYLFRKVKGDLEGRVILFLGAWARTG